ncbi:putative RNA-directed DNA polymerase from transposon BS [Trichonephila clavipes]|uniref:Putative RNA-directed DNA polymerase from transposon BS n=1 Tax=Trichonephila clavipes TaxID=2585209 RepID=A0A8X6W5V4_TRICX|nr:putative RNA-directed DNA polymerase from transposon BS [Trichonephila clavipes]
MFGIGGKALPWIYDFLRNRLIRVKFNNSLSRSFSFFQGGPQGSVLGRTLFSLYLSGIESVIKRKCEVGAFAEDIALWKSDSDLMKLERDINLVLEDIQNFTLDHKLTFNSTKSMEDFGKRNMPGKRVRRHISQLWTREGTHAQKTGPGAARKTTGREDRSIVWQALGDPTVTHSTIRADVGVAIVPQTVSRHLAEANLKSKRPFRALPLTPEHRQLRLQC